MRVDLSPELVDSVRHVAKVAAAARPDAPRSRLVVARRGRRLSAVQRRIPRDLRRALIDCPGRPFGSSCSTSTSWTRVGRGWAVARRGRQLGHGGRPVGVAAGDGGGTGWSTTAWYGCAATSFSRSSRSLTRQRQRCVGFCLIRAQADAEIDVALAVEDAMAAAVQAAAGEELSEALTARIAGALSDPRVRDTLYALAVGDVPQRRSRCGRYWRRLPDRWRVEALVLLAFSAYARGDGPLFRLAGGGARYGGTHRMASMLDTHCGPACGPNRFGNWPSPVTGWPTSWVLGCRRDDRSATGGVARRAGRSDPGMSR